MAPEHGFAAYTKKLVHDFNTKHYKELYNSCSQFRETKNLNIYFYADYLWFNKLLKDSPIKFKYIWNTCKYEDIKNFFNTARVVCLNDTDLELVPENVKLINTMFSKKFAEVSVYEIGTKKTKYSHPNLFALSSNVVKRDASAQTLYKQTDAELNKWIEKALWHGWITSEEAEEYRKYGRKL